MKTRQIVVNGVEVGEHVSTGDDVADLRAARKLVEELGLNPPRKSPARAIFDVAVQFATAASYVYRNDLVATPRKMDAAVPFIVNSAFAIELYLKALLMQHGVKPDRLHELVELYDALPQSALDAVAAAIPKAAANVRLAPDRDFRGDVLALNTSFKDWRYCYERDELGPFYLDPALFVAQALHEAFWMGLREEIPPQRG